MRVCLWYQFLCINFNRSYIHNLHWDVYMCSVYIHELKLMYLFIHCISGMAWSAVILALDSITLSDTLEYTCHNIAIDQLRDQICNPWSNIITCISSKKIYIRQIFKLSNIGYVGYISPEGYELWHSHNWPVTTTSHLPPHLANYLGHQRVSVFV